MKTILKTLTMPCHFSGSSGYSLATSEINSVNGTFSHGQAIMISETGIGTKLPISPVLPDTFEHGTNENQVIASRPTIGTWITGAFKMFRQNAASAVFLCSRYSQMLFLLFAIAITGAVDAIAAPTVSELSGNFSDGQSVTITGNGFGTKSPAPPILWAPFDSTLDPSSLGRATSWQENNCVVWSPNGRSGGAAKTDDTCTLSAAVKLGINTDTLSLNFYPNSYSQKTYIFRHRKMDYTNDSNLKSLEFIGANYTTDANWVFNHSTNQWISQNISPGSYFYLSKSPAELQWATEELVLQASPSPGTAVEADLKWYANGTLLGSTAGSYSIYSGDISNTNNRFSRIVPVYHGAFSQSGSMADTPEYFDSVYVDNTWSRVMLGNAPTWAASTQREIQIPTAWGERTITISVNTGIFTTGQTAYLYVFDSNGAFNSTGYAVTIGSTGSTQPTPTIKAIKMK